MFKKIINLLLLFCLLCPQVVMAQTRLVKGLVVDAEGTPLPGVSVYVSKDANKGVITSMDGKYALTGVVPSDSIVFSYVGFQTQIIKAGNQSMIDIIMQESANELEETVVVAFQKQKKESMIGSINTISPKELKVPQSNLTTALAGRMAGIISYQRSGEPGRDNAEFFVRGVTTFGYKSSPLILIDGLEVSSEDLARLEPENIASFSIMKDATATALYGARGANGVILVTTKSGKKGKIQITARIETSISTPTKIQEFLGGVDYMEMYNRAQRARNPEADLAYSKEKIENTRLGKDPMIYPDVDWYGELFKDRAINTKATVTASGGGEVAQYYLSVAYTNEKGLMRVDNLNNFNNNIDISRYNIRANIDVNLTKTTKAAVKVYSLLDRYNGPSAETTSIFDAIMKANPVNFPKAYDKSMDDQYYYTKHTMFGNMGNANYANPYAQMVSGYKDRFTSTTNALFQVEQDLKMITEGLKLRGMASFQSYGMNENTRSLTPYYYGLVSSDSELVGVKHTLALLSEGSETLGDPTSINTANSSFYFEVAAQYNRTFGGKHDIGALLVGQAKESLNTIGGNALATLPSRNLGLSGRLTYGYDSRYFIEGNFGYNGSEKFAKQNRYGFFPSIGLGWIVSNEKFYPEFMKTAVPNLKLKGTYGLVGNDAISAASDRFFYLSDVTTNDSGYGYTFGYNSNVGYNGYTIKRYANASVGWEVSTKSNYGIEFSLFDKFNFQVEYFTEKRKDIYQKRESIPLTLGTTAPITGNIGKAKSHGVDASMDVNWSITKDWWLSGRLNYTYATSEYIEGGDLKYPESYRNRPGYSLNQNWGYVAERLFIDEEDIRNSPNQFGADLSKHECMPGDIKYVDINKDGKINESDQVAIGYPTIPEIVYGFGVSAGYKIVDFSFFFQGSARSSFFIDPSSIAPFVGYRNALNIVADDYWSASNPNPNAFWPRLSTTTVANNNHQSTWWMRNGAFLRLKTVEIGISVPDKVVRRWGMNQFRVFFSGNNLLCFSKFKLWDPEMGGYGIGYPTQRIYNIGLNVSF